MRNKIKENSENNILSLTSITMAAAFQQQIFALDARFNAYRAPNNPNFSKCVLNYTFLWFIILYLLFLRKKTVLHLIS